MNLQIFIFSILLILAYGYYSLADKHIASSKLLTSYVSHQRAFRGMINQYQSSVYNLLEKAPRKTTPSIPNVIDVGYKTRNSRDTQESEEEEEKCSMNRNCARLNLWPLIQEGKDAHPCLYELFAKLIRNFYGSCSNTARFEYQFLNAWLQAVGDLEIPLYGLENARFTNQDFQTIYYKMLKGAAGMPGLLEYVKIEPSSDKICVFHANPELLTLLFNPDIADKLHTTIHSQDGPRLTPELIERIAVECHTLRIDPQLMNLLELSNYFKHRDQKQFFLSNEPQVHLKKKFIMEAPKRPSLI